MSGDKQIRTGPTKKLSDYKHVQMSLPFIFEEPQPEYSRTIELYDAIPKYYWGRISTKDRKAGQFLDSINREFVFKGENYKVKISPARIETTKGHEMDYYPGEKEELVEDALRKMACDGQGIFLDDHAGVIFTLYELQQELKKMGHNYNIRQIKEALFICQGSRITLKTGDERSVLSSQIFETVGLNTKEDWKGKGKKTKCFVRFNALVTKSIREKTFRQLNYKECMSYNRVLARWFHKRINHVYIQAGYNTPYTIRLSTIIRDSGVKKEERLRNNLTRVREALDEMKEKGVIHNYIEERIIESRKIIDVKFIINPSMNFILDMKKSNVFFKAANKIK